MRTQLTLFVDPADAAVIEMVRSTFNPAQFALINSHVTLCREDELHPITTVRNNMSTLQMEPVTIDFGPPVRFADGKGVLLPAVRIPDSFLHLRKQVLRGITDHPRVQEPHITLIHPRNGTCTDAIFEQISQNSFPASITFRKVTEIVQIDGNAWVHVG